MTKYVEMTESELCALVDQLAEEIAYQIVERPPQMPVEDLEPDLTLEIASKAREIAEWKTAPRPDRATYVETLTRLQEELAALESENIQITARNRQRQSQSIIDRNAVYAELVAIEKHSVETRLQAIRKVRDQLLAETDYTQLPDAPFAPEEQIAWRVYRQALRDLPETYESTGEVRWPTPPGGS